MPTSHNCGSQILEGDLYCQHCGTHLFWSADDEYACYKDDDLDDMLNYLFINHLQKALLKNKLTSYLKFKDVKKLLLRQANNEYVFEITLQNNYISTVDEFYYGPKYENTTQVFCECLQNHTYDGLKSNPKFKNMIKNTGMPIHKIIGGYVTEYLI